MPAQALALTSGTKTYIHTFPSKVPEVDWVLKGEVSTVASGKAPSCRTNPLRVFHAPAAAAAALLSSMHVQLCVTL